MDLLIGRGNMAGCQFPRDATHPGGDASADRFTPERWESLGVHGVDWDHHDPSRLALMKGVR